MSLIRHGFWPRRLFDSDPWFRAPNLGFGPSSLDLFDPFDDLDRHFARNFTWLDTPDFIRHHRPLLSRVPSKHRITVDCSGFNPKSIKTEIRDNKIVVSGSDGDKRHGEDYSIKEFKKTYDIPPNADTEKLVSFLTPGGRLVIEIPLKGFSKSNEDLFPRIVDGENGIKNLSMKFALPSNIDPAKINVTCKDHELVIQAEENLDKTDSNSHTYFYRRTTLPENADLNTLKCVYDNNQVSVTAKINHDSTRAIPIEVRNQIKN